MTHPGKAARGPAVGLDACRGKLVAYLRVGNYIETSCALVGLPRRTFYRWVDRGKRQPGVEPFGSFARDVEAALAQSEANDNTVIGKAAVEGDWKAAAWRLERKQWRRWGPKSQVQISIEGEWERMLNVVERVCCANCRVAVLDELGREGEGEGGGAAAPG